jgi:fructokinase
VLHGEPVRVNALVDTVGAGDAFTAVVLLGLLQGWPLEKMLRHALAFTAHLCEVRGAVLSDRRYYETCLSQWNSSG